MKKILLLLAVFIFTTSTTFAASWQIQQARQEYNAGAYSNALKSINAAISDSSSKDIECYKIRADIYLKLNSPVSAIKDLNIVLENNSSPELLNKRAWAYYKTNDFEKALTDFADASNTGSIEYLRNGGVRTFMSGMKAIANNPNAPIKCRFFALQGIESRGRIYCRNSSNASLCSKYILICKICATLSEKYAITEIENNPTKYNKPEFLEEYINNDYGKGVWEYCKGDKELGKKMMLGELKEKRERETDPNIKFCYTYIINNFQSIINALDTSKIEFDINLF